MTAKKILRTIQSFAFVPLLSVTSPMAILDEYRADLAEKVLYGRAKEEEAKRAKSLEDRAAKIEDYFATHNLPLKNSGLSFVLTAEKYGLDWRLLPAIAMRESTGGKFACGNNPFGWGSCRINFESVEEAIEVVGLNLAGENPKTAYFYKGKTISEKLRAYNGPVVPNYPNEVLAIMNLISKEEIAQ